MFRPILLGVFVFLFAISASAQESVPAPAPDSADTQANPAQEDPKPDLTEDETRQSRSIADEFTRRMLDGEDAAGVADDLFVPDFIERFQGAQQKRLLDDDGRAEESELFVMNDELWKTADAGSLRRYYLAMTEVFSSLSAIMFSEAHDTDEDDDDWQKMIEPSVKALGEGDRFAAALVADDGDDVSVETPSDLAEVTQSLSRLSKQLRKDHPGADFDTVNQTKSGKGWSQDHDNEPELVTFDRDAYGFPAGTRFVRVNTITGMFLLLVPDDGGLKIAWADMCGD